MNHFRFASFFAERRKQLKVTQEDVANYIGISKAAISKWEKGQSYPDITLLPKLATYFNTSIDELLGYEPQMTMDKIMELYSEFSTKFNDVPFENVQHEIESYISEYYACFPFLLKMGQLYFNYYKKAEDQKAVLARIETLCERVKEFSDDHNLAMEATNIHAVVKIISNEPQQVLQLLGSEPKLVFGEETLIANAYMMQGNTEKAKEVLHVAHFQHFMMTLSSATESLLIDMPNFDETVHRVGVLIDTYHVENLNVNSALVFYLKAAVGYMMTNRQDEALQMIEKYVKCCSKIKFPVRLNRDDYFSLLEQWMKKQTNITIQAPRSDEAIKVELLSTIEQQPIFTPLAQRKDFQILITNLKHSLKL